MEIGAAEISEIEAEITERRRIGRHMRGLSDRRDERRCRVGRRPLRREDADPEIVFDVVAELLQRRYVRQRLRARAAERGEGAKLPGLDVAERRRDRLRGGLRVVA